MNRHIAVDFSRVAVILSVALFVSTVAEAQWTRTPPPPNSPYWWTLTDTISPSELRNVLQDREAHRERYREAKANAESDEMATEQEIYQVGRYVAGSSHPELFPMYVAFQAYVSRFEIHADWPETNARLLTDHGMSPEGIAVVAEAARDQDARRQEIMEEVKAPVAELMALLAPLLDEIGNERLVAHLAAGEIGALARLTGRDMATIARLQRAWKRDPIVEASLPILERLRDELTADDWQALRRMLLTEVAPGMSVLELREDAR